ncbi:IS1 family transposase [Holospora obtusa]|nr:IS1 family transposase [Holospora obtusa]
MLFLKSLPKNRHNIGKSGTVCIEQDHSNTRHHLGHMTRRTKVVSKNECTFYTDNGDAFSKISTKKPP